MASTAVERKAKERAERKARGFIRKEIWLEAEAVLGLEQYKRQHGLTDTEAINALLKGIKKGST